MTERTAEIILRNRLQQLQIIQENLEEFEEKDGKRGVQQRIDEILDDINYYKQFTNKNKNNENEGEN